MTDDKTELQRTPDAKPDVPRGKWKVQRGMAIAAFCASIAYVVAGLFVDEKAQAFLSDMAVFFFGLMGSIVLTWYGSSTVANWKR